MKTLILNTAAASNGGARLAAGAVVAVGGKADQIEAARARALVADGSASAPSAKDAAAE